MRRYNGSFIAFAAVMLVSTSLFAIVGTEPLTVDVKVLSRLHKANQDEISLGRLALERSQNQEVRAFAQMLIDDHSAADPKVLQLALTEQLTLVEPKPETQEEAELMQQ